MPIVNTMVFFSLSVSSHLAAPMFDHDTMKVKASVTVMAINITS